MLQINIELLADLVLICSALVCLRPSGLANQVLRQGLGTKQIPDLFGVQIPTIFESPSFRSPLCQQI